MEAHGEGHMPVAKGWLGVMGARSRCETETKEEGERKKEQPREGKATARCTTGALGPRARPKGTGAVQCRGPG